MDVPRERVIAFRVARNNLARRLTPGSVTGAAGVLGLRTTAPGAAVTAAHARVGGIDQRTVPDAIAARELVEVLSIRSTPQLVPVDDLAVFTAGALPHGDDSLADVLAGLARAFDDGVRPTEALALAAAAARDALDGRMLTRGELSAAMTERLPAALAPFCAGCQVDHVEETLFRLAGVTGAYCRAAGHSASGGYVRTDQWLDGRPAADDQRAARDELVRRYLRSQGPSTAAELAAWLAIDAADARASLDRLRGELAEVSYAGRPRQLLRDDVAALRRSSRPSGVRLLPPYDPLVNTVDRETLVPDRGLQKLVWQALNSSGAVLVDGAVVAAWRGRKAGRRLEVKVTPAAGWQEDRTDEVLEEARALAPLRGCADAVVEVAGR